MALSLTYAHRAVGCGPRCNEMTAPGPKGLQKRARADTQSSQTHHTPTADSAEHLIARGPGTVQMALCKAAVRRVGGQEM
eukprot:2949340-Prymnesium_polylepis.2